MKPKKEDCFYKLTSGVYEVEFPLDLPEYSRRIHYSRRYKLGSIAVGRSWCDIVVGPDSIQLADSGCSKKHIKPKQMYPLSAKGYPGSVSIGCYDDTLRNRWLIEHYLDGGFNGDAPCSIGLYVPQLSRVYERASGNDIVKIQAIDSIGHSQSFVDLDRRIFGVFDGGVLAGNPGGADIAKKFLEKRLATYSSGRFFYESNDPKEDEGLLRDEILTGVNDDMYKYRRLAKAAGALIKIAEVIDDPIHTHHAIWASVGDVRIAVKKRNIEVPVLTPESLAKRPTTLPYLKRKYSSYVIGEPDAIVIGCLSGTVPLDLGDQIIVRTNGTNGRRAEVTASVVRHSKIGNGSQA